MEIKSEGIRKLQERVAINRDESAYKKIFIQLFKSGTSFTTSITKSEEVSEEIYADTMMKLWLMEGKLLEINDLRKYVFILLKNSALNYLKKEKNKLFLSIDEMEKFEIPAGGSLEDKIVFSELENQLEQFINNLPVKCQIVYKLIKNEGFTYKQTSDILNISINTIEGHMTNALKKISVFLKSIDLKN